MQKILAASLRILHLLAAILFLWWIAGPFLFGQQADIPPDVLMVNDLSCVIHKRGEHHFQATCTASYANHEHNHHEPWVIELPEEKTEKASYNDTVKWRKMLLKIQAAASPISVGELKKEK